MRTSKHKITFEGNHDVDMLSLAQLGQSNHSIQCHVPLSDGQINYRLRKAKTYHSKYSDLRKNWRNGDSMLFKRVRDDMLAILRTEIKRTLPAAILRTQPNGQTKTG